MSEAAEDPKTLAGHAPAVKVGGMRVAPHKHGKDKPAEEKAVEEDTTEYETPPKSDKHHQQILLSGAVTKGDKDFPPEAVKAIHEKPQPTHENRHPNVQHTRVIMQPRKQ